MLVILSPAKALNFSALPRPLPVSQPELAARTATLLPVVKALSAADLKRLMDISDTLADLNHARFQAMHGPLEITSSQAAADGQGLTGKQAALAFDGDTYTGLDASTLDEADWQFAQQHLRILSGLYGLLRPLDVIEPYRLEMGTRLENPDGKDLYSFWKTSLPPALDAAAADAAGEDGPVIINCASSEYFKAAAEKTLKSRVITPVFHECRDGKGRVIGLMAKRARGMMARYIVTNRLTRPEQIRDFTSGGYRWQEEGSSDRQWIFSRPQP